MTLRRHRGALKDAKGEVQAIAEDFTRAAPFVVRAALERRLEALLQARGAWFGSLAPDVATAFRASADRAIRAGSDEVVRRLKDPALWLSPFTAPGVVGRPEGWDGYMPEWLTGILRQLTRRRAGPSLEELDDPSNRIWVALLSAAKPLDPVLEEFGLPPSPIPSLGGGHYGIQPKTAQELDPTGLLVRLWDRYRLAYERYAARGGAPG